MINIIHFKFHIQVSKDASIMFSNQRRSSNAKASRLGNWLQYYHGITSKPLLNLSKTKGMPEMTPDLIVYHLQHDYAGFKRAN